MTYRLFNNHAVHAFDGSPFERPRGTVVGTIA
jgi:hypothetical protein